MYWFLLGLLSFLVLLLLRVKRGYFSLLSGLITLGIWLDAGLGIYSLSASVFTLLLLLLLHQDDFRQQLLSKPLLTQLRKRLPRLSRTEQEALDAGDTWWEAELFSGRPDWQSFQAIRLQTLSNAEQSVIDGPVEDLCRRLDDWQITHQDKDLPPEIWELIKQQGLFGMIIPKRYGGLEFSAQAHSDVIVKIASRSVTAAVTVMVPNSLGPAKLLLEYGTPAQKEYFLPRLASGAEIPCFALTNPQAGSDAGAIPDTGIICRQTFQGKLKVLGIRLNWEKRYITLGPVATLLGLAFHLYDPDHLLAESHDIGITLALIPTSHPGVEIGERHLPLDIPFQNGPNRGKDVFIPLDWVIGGQAQLGNGWRMLMESLAEGRGISLPALATGAAKTCARLTGAYAAIRRQFKHPIGHFEGVEEALARIAGQTYLIESGRLLTLNALDHGLRPAIVSAMMKYQLTERMRQIVNDAMDIHGGAGICLGPHNYLGRVYQAVPIAITVEGANILTRSLIIFGQGAIRCHPWLLQAMNAARHDNPQQRLGLFDAALRGHLRYFLQNAARALWLGLSAARFEKTLGTDFTQDYYRRLARLSAIFAWLSDWALIRLGGKLKRRERLSGKFADALSNLYLCTASLKRFEADGEAELDRPLMNWACEHSLHQTQQALLATLHQLPHPWFNRLLRWTLFSGGKFNPPPSDELIHHAAQMLMHPSAARDRLTQGIFLSSDENDGAGRIEAALQHDELAAFASLKLRENRISNDPEGWENAYQRGLLTHAEIQLLAEAERYRRNAVKVDAFPFDALKPGGKHKPMHSS